MNKPRAPRPQPAPAADPAERPLEALNLRLGWTLLLLFMAGGLLLEALHGIKLPLYLENHLRRELWTLAHAHGALLAILNLVYAGQASRLLEDPVRRRRASLTLAAGAVLMPAGFFLGGIGNSESDPSLAILLTPLGALLLLHAAASCTLAAWRR